MFRVLKQLFTSPFSYFYSEFSGLNQAIAQPSAEDLLATQGMALLSDKYLFIKSKNRQEYVSLQKKMVAADGSLGDWVRVNQWQAFLEQLFKLHEIPDLQKVNTYQSAFYYWVKWGLHGSFLGEELLIDQHLQQQISTHPLSIPALLAPGEHSLTALHWLFLDRCQKKPKFFLNIFLPALSLAIPENLSQVVTILLQPFTYGSLDH